MRRRLPALCVDTAAVIGFVALGRSSHAEGETIGGVGVVAAPFLIGLAAGWVLSRHTTRPAGLRTGLVVWGTTLIVGLPLRALVFSRPTPIAFVLVAATVLGALLLGWRAAWALLRRIRNRGAAATEAGLS